MVDGKRGPDLGVKNGQENGGEIPPGHKEAIKKLDWLELNEMRESPRLKIGDRVRDRVVKRHGELNNELSRAKQVEWTKTVARMSNKSDGTIPPKDFSISKWENMKNFIKAVDEIEKKLEEEKRNGMKEDRNSHLTGKKIVGH